MKRNLKIALLIKFIFFIFYIVLYRNISNDTSNDQQLLLKLSKPAFYFEKPQNLTFFHLKVLIICRSTKSTTIKSLVSLLEALRFDYKLVTVYSLKLNKKVNLSDKNKSFFSLVIFESVDVYDSIGCSNQDYLFKYCQLFDVGIIYLLSNILTKKHKYTINGIEFRLNSINTKYSDSCYLKYENIQNVNSFFKLTKFSNENVLFKNKNKDNQFINQIETDQLFESIIKCDSKYNLMLKTKDQPEPKIRQVFIGFDLLNLAILSPLLIDSITYSSHNRFNYSTTRYLQIDIDDIFVAATGTRMKQSDVIALVLFQNLVNKEYFNQSLEKFKFNLGFSGYYYQNGNEEENMGDSALIGHKNYFNWFDHSWAHYQVHLLNGSYLKEQMYLNLNFALNHGIPIDSFYAVSPHHSGIYPVNDLFYKYWSDIWMIKATSTEGYPHLKPFYLRRGFIHNNIMVLPRQTCGIFTHTIFLNKYPNGIDKLLAMINGGELFNTVLHNKILIFMTHFTNYANDRIALFVFKHLFEYVHKWTNLNFKSLAPLKIAEKYFELFKEDTDPLWTNICDDKRHLAIWSLNETIYCDRFPKLIIIGPQKTGSTALLTYLNLHPNLKSNKMLQDTFEETQFFTDKYYHNGIDWYLSLFDQPMSKKTILFEKSANYFSDPNAPIRIKTMLKDLNLIYISINPADRAYSWYQHMRAHNDSIATQYSFYDVLTLNTKDKKVVNRMKTLRNRCLDPGLYSKHLKNWFKYFSPKQLILLDGDLLRTKPYECLNQLQKQLAIETRIDYKQILKFNKKKGFYCVNYERKVKCLGQSKGRHYPAIDSNSKAYLTSYYNNSNKKFYDFLRRYSYNIPMWLKN